MENEVKEKIAYMYKNILKPEKLESMFVKSDDLVTIGTDAGEWINGYDTMMKAGKKQAEVIPDMKIVKSNPKVQVKGSVAWYNDQITVKVNDQEVNMRVTGVLQQEEDDWKFIQNHWSIGMPNEETAFGNVNIME